MWVNFEYCILNRKIFFTKEHMSIQLYCKKGVSTVSEREDDRNYR